MALVSLYGFYKVETDFNVEVLIPPESATNNYFQLALKYGWTSYPTTIYVEDPDLDYASEDVQHKLKDYYDKL